MQWLATPLNALDSAIDRLTTPRRVDAGDGDSPAIVRGRKVGDVAAVAVALIADTPPVAAPF